MDFEVTRELIGTYLEDARAQLEALDRALLALEREGPEGEAASSALGPLHTLKGNSAMIGFSGIQEYVHGLEDVFARLRESGVRPPPAALDRLFAGASALREAVEAACQAGREVRDLSGERAVLEAVLERGLEGEAASAPAPSRPGPSRAASAPAPRSSVVRVEFAQLDHLLNLVGELVIYRNKLHELGRAMAPLLGAGAAGRDLLEAVQQLSRVSSELQETIMDVRMLPVRGVFDRFPRLVRDLARQQGKQIELMIEGEETRVDKAIIDEIGEPLVHLVRNSIDHGIEPPEVRARLGKSPTGTILLSAAQESSQVVITVMDDGAGIDAARVRQKAIERGLLKGTEMLSDRDAVQLIFSEGFSTAERVTELSGRGVGLDVVLKSIGKLNGFVEAESIPGVGTRFVIQLPLTLAIISALLVEVEGCVYALPLSAVVETLRFRPTEVHAMSGQETLRLRDRIVPLLRLGQAFGLGEGAASYAVVLGRGDKRLAVAVDRLRGEQEVVIKGLDPSVSGAAFAVAGATIMGDGRVVLILDVAALFEGKRPGRPETPAPVGDS